MKKKIIKIGVIIISLAVIAVAGWFGYRYFFGSIPEMPAFNPEESIATVTKGEIKETVTASGVVALADEYEVYAEGESNIVKEFLVEEGDDVTEGQLLVNYDVDDKKEEYESKIKELEINLKNEQMSLQSIGLPLSDSEKKELENNITQAEKTVYDTEVKISNYTDTISKQQTAISTAERTVNNAKSDLDKAKKTASDNKELYEAGAITKQDYDDSVDEVKKAQDTYDDAVQALADAKSELTIIEKDKASDEYTLKNAKSSVELAKSKLQTSSNPMSSQENQIKYKQQENQIQLTQNSLNDYKKKLADLVFSTSSLVSGRVTEICIDEGTYTEENTVMLKIANFNQLIVQASISEYDAPDIEIGQEVTMTTDGIEGKTYTGKVIKINASASSESTTMGSETVVPVEISVDNPDGVLKPGYNLDLEIITVNKSDALTVPTASIIKDSENNEYYTFVIGDDQKIKKTVVGVEVYGDTSSEISSGLNEGDKVIATASADMKDGMSMMEAMTLTSSTSSKSSNDKNSNEKSGGMMFGGGMGGAPSGGMGGAPSGGMGGGGPR